MPIVNASSLTAEKDELLLEIGSTVSELNTAISGFNSYLTNNKSRIASTLTIENLQAISTYLHADDYTRAFSSLENLLNNTELNNLELTSKINAYFELKQKLFEFVQDNALELNVDTGTLEGLDCATEIFDQLKTSFNLIKPNISNLFESISDVFVEIIKLKIAENSNLQTSEFNALIDEYKELGSILASLATKYSNSLDSYFEIFETIGGTEGLFESTFKKKFRDDLNNAANNAQTKLESSINNFILTRKTKLENKVNEIISSDKTDQEKNAEIYEKIDQVTAVNDKFVSAINEIIGSLTIESIRDKINDLLERGNTEFADAKAYLRNHLIGSGEYDINLISTHDEKISLDSINEIIILDKLFNIDEFKRQIELANNLGTLSFNFNNYENVPNKAKVIITDNNQVQKEYQVIVKGDINGSGSVTVTDVVLAANYSLESIELDQYEQMAADANSNNSVTVTDVYLIAMKALD